MHDGGHGHISCGSEFRVRSLALERQPFLVALLALAIQSRRSATGALACNNARSSGVVGAAAAWNWIQCMLVSSCLFPLESGNRFFDGSHPLR
jgi:hypothetical protein